MNHDFQRTSGLVVYRADSVQSTKEHVHKFHVQCQTPQKAQKVVRSGSTRVSDKQFTVGFHKLILIQCSLLIIYSFHYEGRSRKLVDADPIMGQV